MRQFCLGDEPIGSGRSPMFVGNAPSFILRSVRSEMVVIPGKVPLLWSGAIFS